MTINSFEGAVSADFNLPTNVNAGSSIRAHWAVKPIQSQGNRYLVIASPDDRLRFSGEGFFALTPEARAPQSMRFEDKSVRVIVPLSGALANPAGSADIFFYHSGSQPIRWAIIEVGKDETQRCIERILRSGETQVTVNFGLPELLPQNRFDNFVSESTFVSTNGRFLLHQGKQRYRIVDRVTGDLLLDRSGTKPHFSPTGRFLSALDDAGRLEIIDLVANRSIHRTSEEEDATYGAGGALIWMDGDSVVIEPHGRKGAVTLLMPMIDDRRHFSGWLNCNACEGFSSHFWLDIDRMSFAVHGEQAKNWGPGYSEPYTYFLSLLETADSPNTIHDSEPKSAANRQDNSAPKRPHFIATPFDVSGSDRFFKDQTGHWNSSDELRVTHTDDWADGSKEEQKKLAERVKAEPAERITKQAQLLLRDHQLPQTIVESGRTVRRAIQVDGRVVTRGSQADQMVNAMATFGVRFAAQNKRERWDVPKIDKTIFGSVVTIDDEDTAFKAIEKKLLSRENVSPFVLRNENSKTLQPDRLLARNYSAAQCGAFSQTDKTGLPLTVVSAFQLKSLWTFDRRKGRLFLAFQRDGCGTAPEWFGELLLIECDPKTNLPRRIRRLAFSDAFGGVVESRTKGQRSFEENLGEMLGLAQVPALDAYLILDRYLLVLCRDRGTTVIFDLKSTKNVHVVKNMPNALDIESLQLTGDLAALVQLNQGGDFYAYNLNLGKQVLAGRYIDQEITFYDSAMRFEGSPEGADYVFLRIPGSDQLYSLDQFERRLHSPGTALRQLGRRPSFDPPATGMTPPYLNATRQKERIFLEARSERPLKRIQVVVDGVTRTEIPLKGDSAAAEASLADYPGAHWVNFIAENVEGIRSVYRSFQLGDTPYRGTLRAVIVGIDLYNRGSFQRTPVSDLAFAHSDAMRFAAAVRDSLAPHYEGAEVIAPSLTANSREALLTAVKASAERTKERDTLMLFFASHGHSDEKGFSLILPPAAPMGEITLLHFSQIAQALTAARGRVIVFLDACHSASAVHDMAVQQLVEGHENVTVIAASKGKQASFESSKWGGGAFTSALIEQLTTHQSGGHEMTIEEMYGAIRNMVLEQTGGRQTPWLRRASWQGAQSLK